MLASVILPLATALIAGFVHALEPDHMAAVTTFVSRRPRTREALGFGVRWGLGHSAAILGAGLVLVLLRLQVPEGLARGLEFGVGGILLALGLWLFWTLMHGHAHTAAHAGGEPHRHAHGSTWVGVAHGLAGTAPLIALLPIATGPSPWAAAAYLLFFGVGTVVAMAAYAAFAGWAFGRVGKRSPLFASGMRMATALGSAALGIAWMYGAWAGGA